MFPRGSEILGWIKTVSDCKLHQLERWYRTPKSLEGMLRSLLHLAIEKCPKLLSVPLHDQVSTFRERVDSEGSMKRLGLCLTKYLERREIH